MKAYSNVIPVLAFLVLAVVSSDFSIAQRAGPGGAPAPGGGPPPGGPPPGGHPPAGPRPPGFAYPPGGGHWHGYGRGYGWGVSIGVPLYWPGYYYPGYAYPYGYPAYYYPAPVYTYPSPPAAYVEQSVPQATTAPAQSQGDWYFCASANAFYPYVRECAEGWQRVPSIPPR